MRRSKPGARARGEGVFWAEETHERGSCKGQEAARRAGPVEREKGSGGRSSQQPGHTGPKGMVGNWGFILRGDGKPSKGFIQRKDIIQFMLQKDRSRPWVGNETYFIFTGIAGSRRVTNISREAGRLGELQIDLPKGFLGGESWPRLQALVLI